MANATEQQMADVRIACDNSGNQLWYMLRDLVSRFGVKTELTFDSSREEITKELIQIVRNHPEFLGKYTSYLGSRVSSLESARARIKWAEENTIYRFDTIPEDLRGYFTKHCNRYASNGVLGNYVHKPEEKSREDLHTGGQWFELVEFEKGLGFVANACIWITLTSVTAHKGGWILEGYGQGLSNKGHIYVYPKGEKEELRYVAGGWLPESILQQLDA
jgi:hypothetical protein